MTMTTNPSQPAAGVGEEIMVNTPYDVFTLPLQPSGVEGKGPRFVVHVPAPEQQPAENSITRREQELIAAAATHCDNCGCSWLDNGLNPVGCPYCKQRELLALAEQWERDAAGCRRDGYIDAAVVKEDCAQRIRQTLGISAIAKALSQPPAAADDEEKRDVWRTLWLVLRQTGTVVVPPHDIVSTDWSKCQIEQTVHQLTGAVQLRAILLPTKHKEPT